MNDDDMNKLIITIKKFKKVKELLKKSKKDYIDNTISKKVLNNIEKQYETKHLLLISQFMDFMNITKIGIDIEDYEPDINEKDLKAEGITYCIRTIENFECEFCIKSVDLVIFYNNYESW